MAEVIAWRRSTNDRLARGVMVSWTGEGSWLAFTGWPRQSGATRRWGFSERFPPRSTPQHTGEEYPGAYNRYPGYGVHVKQGFPASPTLRRFARFLLARRMEQAADLPRRQRPPLAPAWEQPALSGGHTSIVLGGASLPLFAQQIECLRREHHLAPCSTRMMPRALSMCFTFSFTTSLTRKPAP